MSALLRVKQAVKDAVSRLPGGEWLVKQRFAKFGAVGFAGTIVNVGVLYLADKFVYRGVESPDLRANLALATAIFIATAHNFLWNRAWTWGDRKVHGGTSIVVQFFQYCASCSLAIALQVLFTNVLRQHTFLELANFLAIGISAVLNYLINHNWTFRVRKPPQKGSGS
ncbi:MAG: GtrA family protein [Syntrophales bacterium]|jgi:dolichol-phosphate mannosyltransferase|nr:GtrA family protein [Syntrophales bacterium]MCU0584362.1 GtrA family protein [Syntrophales bacterium]